MHYKVFEEAMKIAREMPHDELVSILKKPSSIDRKADQLWRRTCLKHGVDTSPIGIKTSDPKSYERNYSAARSLESARAEIVELKKQVAEANTKLALYKVQNR